MRVRKASESESLFTRRELLNRYQNRGVRPSPGGVWGRPAYCPGGIRRRGGASLTLASARNVRTWTSMLRETSKRKKP